jgi:D-arabinose 1-dehydrogenase-like Zn-dependent alcohol dehydrogenase
VQAVCIALRAVATAPVPLFDHLVGAASASFYAGLSRLHRGGREDLAEAIAFADEGKVKAEIHRTKLDNIARFPRKRGRT